MSIQNPEYKIQNPPCRAVWLGTREYADAWAMQKALAAQRFDSETSDVLLLLEHPPTLTLGRAAHRENLLADEADLRRRGVAISESDRGGDITYHGPGQLVAYPILNLQDAPHTADLHDYLRKLEAVLIRTLAHFGLTAGRFPGYTGVWLHLDSPAPVKIAAIGVKAGRWITQHGFAFNVAPDLAHFDWIVPCGIRDYGVTSLARELERDVSVAEVFPVVVAAFGEIFGLEMQTSV